jgi:hypothetical protein
VDFFSVGEIFDKLEPELQNYSIDRQRNTGLNRNFWRGEAQREVHKNGPAPQRCVQK